MKNLIIFKVPADTLATEEKQDDTIENQTDGSQKTQISSIGSGGSVDGIDASTNTLQNIEYEHHEIHAGSHYFISDYESFANGIVKDFTFITPDTDEEAHFIFSISGTYAVSIEVLVGADVNVSGTVITPVNNNGNSDNASNMVVRHGDTFNSVGVSKLRSYSGANKVAGTVERVREIVLARDQTYIMRVTNQSSSANIIQWDANWYEHTPKN